MKMREFPFRKKAPQRPHVQRKQPTGRDPLALAQLFRIPSPRGGDRGGGGELSEGRDKHLADLRR